MQLIAIVNLKKVIVVWASAISPAPVFHPLDNTDNFRIIIYKCTQLAQNCGLCLGLNKDKFECGWCEEESHCVPKSSCSTTSWLSNKQEKVICPHPQIEDFFPKKGPIDGGTKVKSLFLKFLGISLG